MKNHFLHLKKKLEIGKENFDNLEKDNHYEAEDFNLLNSLSNEKNFSYNIQKLVNSFDLV